MFDLSFAELLLISVVALVVIGPQDLPKVIRAVMNLFKQVQGMMQDVRQSVDDIVNESGVDDFKKETRYLIDQNGDYQEIYDISELMKKDGKPSDE